LRPPSALFYNLCMYNDDNDDILPSGDEEVGSDELLAADELRLPPGANILVRLHAMRAWLNRRYTESGQEVGLAALDLQETTRAAENEARPRRRLAQNDFAVQRAQRFLVSTQERQHAYDEARALLEDCVAHTTTGDRLLVEYYLSLEERVLSPNSPTSTPWLEAMQDVMHRVEQVGTPGEDEEE
jgi:hypothetical protein